jgi:hypothetical protein
MSRPPPPPNGYHRNPSNGSNPTLHMSSSNSAMNPHSRMGTPQRPPSSGAASRAERFEDEKRRIIESCFSKVDANGQLSESYITHIRIQEDSVHSSSPPPPDSPPENRKPRLIIIAVRSTGRVRMHKARENNNGSFSIGKTWNLEELSARAFRIALCRRRMIVRRNTGRGPEGLDLLSRLRSRTIGKRVQLRRRISSSLVRSRSTGNTQRA